jgi:hypothetical protein
MLRDHHRQNWCGRTPVAAALALALFAAGCSSGSSLGTAAPAPSDPSAPPPSSPSLKDKVANFFSSSSAKSPQPVANAAGPDVYCPYIDIRDGAATLLIPPPPPDGANDAMALKYQGTFVRAARDCAVVAGQIVMRVGIEGRIILGPAGGPGQIDVPLRVAVVDEETTGSKLIVTKLIHVPVAITSAAESPTFTHIEEGLAFPMPSGGILENYIVYIGFDPVGAAASARAKPEPKPKAKAKPKPPTG